MILDFENSETVRASVLRILEMTEKELDDFLRSFKLEDDFDGYPDEQFFNFLNSNNLIKNQVERISWFHLTRVWDGEKDFQDGIVPLEYALDKIWSNIRAIWNSVAEEDFLSFKNKYIFNSEMYSLKVSHTNHGPCAYLMKDVAFLIKDKGNKNYLGEHDYLNEPEIIRDIFDEIIKRYNEDLRPKYLQITKPAIVKFYNNSNTNEKIGNAMWYLYEKSKETKNELRANIGVDLMGQHVKDIVYVEIL
jgi:hypothetical protein